ncbi:MAG TPA: hypothetical protein VMZ28_05410 [Kofleriaceae bacterium]|nr:hypothetical protein [Kofleriaceae bacterium]
MDEFEVLIAILRGLYKLVRFIFVSLFRLVRGAFRFVARAQSGGAAAQRQPARSVPPAASRPAPPPPRARPTYLAGMDPSHPDWVPPPPPPGAMPARRRPMARPTPALLDDFFDPAAIRDAIVLDAVMRRRRQGR